MKCGWRSSFLTCSLFSADCGYSLSSQGGQCLLWSLSLSSWQMRSLRLQSCIVSLIKLMIITSGKPMVPYSSSKYQHGIPVFLFFQLISISRIIKPSHWHLGDHYGSLILQNKRRKAYTRMWLAQGQIGKGRAGMIIYLSWLPVLRIFLLTPCYVNVNPWVSFVLIFFMYIILWLTQYDLHSSLLSLIPNDELDK